MTRKPHAIQTWLTLPVDAFWSVFDERKRRLWCKANGCTPSPLSWESLCSNCGRRTDR